MRIGMPEILAAGSAALLATGHATYGWVFLGLAIMGSAARWGAELQAIQQAEEAKKKDVDDVAQLLTEAGKAFTTLLQNIPSQSNNNKNDSQLH